MVPEGRRTPHSSAVHLTIGWNGGVHAPTDRSKFPVQPEECVATWDATIRGGAVLPGF